LFILDDQFDEENIGKQPAQLAVLNAVLLDILKGADTDNQIEPLGAALQDIRKRMMLHKANAFLTSRFIRSVEECLTGGVWEATNRARDITPDVSRYIKMREFTSSVVTILNLILIAFGIELPPEVLNHIDVQRLSLKANNIICWANDISSFDKEMRCGDVHNLVLTLRHKHQHTLQEAIQCAATIHDNEVRAFMELETQLPSFGKDIDFQLERYVSGLRSWIRGSLDWHCTSERYRLTELGSL
jgi:5-epi-alpha-selinene synthase